LQTLVEHQNSGIQTGPAYVGQSLLVTGGPFNDVRFNWIGRLVGGARRASAFGTLYVLSREYLGTPFDLSPATPGFVARSAAIVSDEYIFENSVILSAGRYWFYSDTTGPFTTGNGNTYPEGDCYVLGEGSMFRKFAVRTLTDFVDAEFRLQARLVRRVVPTAR
jgi:hypothetical protein